MLSFQLNNSSDPILAMRGSLGMAWRGVACSLLAFVTVNVYQTHVPPPFWWVECVSKHLLRGFGTGFIYSSCYIFYLSSKSAFSSSIIFFERKEILKSVFLLFSFFESSRKIHKHSIGRLFHNLHTHSRNIRNETKRCNIVLKCKYYLSILYKQTLFLYTS